MPVAARLAENPKIRVAVIEAGDFYNNSGGNLSAVPGYGYKVSVPGYKTPSAVDWGFQTVPQGALGNRTLLYNRGRTVGGSSTTNLMAYHRVLHSHSRSGQMLSETPATHSPTS